MEKKPRWHWLGSNQLALYRMCKARGPFPSAAKLARAIMDVTTATDERVLTRCVALLLKRGVLARTEQGIVARPVEAWTALK